MRTAALLVQQSPHSVAAVALLLSCPWIRAQTPGQLPEFEVASIKPNKTNERMYYGLRNATLTVRNMTVKGLVQIAYGKREFQITGGPAWITAEFFDIDAKAEQPQGATQDMLKSLLASRFRLQLHSETKETSVYSLGIARGGLRMKLSADQTDPQKGVPKDLGPGRIVGEGVPIYVIVNLLADMLGGAVINKTGLTGKYDVNLQPLSESLPLQSDPANPLAQADVLNLAIIDAVEKRLGLKIGSMRAPEKVLVIDHVERPSAN